VRAARTACRAHSPAPARSWTPLRPSQQLALSHARLAHAFEFRTAALTVSNARTVFAASPERENDTSHVPLPTMPFRPLRALSVATTPHNRHVKCGFHRLKQFGYNRPALPITTFLRHEISPRYTLADHRNTSCRPTSGCIPSIATAAVGGYLVISDYRSNRVATNSSYRTNK